MIVKLYRVLLPVPSLILQNHALKSTSQSKGYVVTIVKPENRKKANITQKLVNEELFGPVLNTPFTRRKKIKPKKSPATDFHQDYSNISSFSPSPIDNNNNLMVYDDISQLEHSSNLSNSDTKYSSISNEKAQFSLKDTLLSDFNAFNESKFNNIYPQNDNIFNIRSFYDEYHKFPSVTKILQDTMPPERKLILQKWEENMIKELGEEGFRSYKQDMFDRGTLFHSYVEQSLQNKIEDDFQNVEQYIKSVKSVLEDIKSVKLLESRVIHPHLHYKGYVDCVGLYRGSTVVIDFKTSAKSKSTLSSTYDSPLQVVAYLGALNYDPSYDALPNECQLMSIN